MQMNIYTSIIHHIQHPVRWVQERKMDTMKKFFAMALAAVMLLAMLTACGGNTANNTTGNNAGNTAGNTGTNSTGDDAADTGDTSAYGDFASSLVEEGKLIMATNAQFPPYEMVADGEGFNGTGFEGIDVEIASAIAEKLGLELVIEDMEFTSALLAVQNNSADVVLAGLSYREDRDEVMDFTDSYATGIQVVIVPEGSDITDLDGLNGKLIGCQAGTTGYTLASDTPENGGYGEENVRAYDSGATAGQALLNGQIHAVIIDNAPAQEFVNANEGLTILESPWLEENYCAAVDEGNAALLEAVNTAINELIDDGTVQSIIDKYITAE